MVTETIMVGTVFRGKNVIRGTGFGSVFANLFRSIALPYLKRGGAYLGRKLLTKGLAAGGDVLSGISPKEAFKTRLKEAGGEVLETVKSKMAGGGRKRKRGASNMNYPPKKKPRKASKASKKKKKKSRRKPKGRLRSRLTVF